MNDLRLLPYFEEQFEDGKELLIKDGEYHA
jgi:hypothetical protein